MKILMVCAGGMSTGILMNKLKKYWEGQEMPLTMKASSLGEYKNVHQDYDVILVGPQVAYRLDMIRKDTDKPCSVIPSNEYALGNCPAIYKLAEQMYAEHPELNPLD